ncbi:MAG: 50S ribosomal protein L30 [Bifidobacterium psychraerophilum]|uniref:50S ribosomal protein L30 n=1 Tax=Bifidobacterium psychraerophilum TaxID=218140 RepID=UPI0039E970D1
MAKQIKITLTKGLVNSNIKQRENVRSLGLHKIGQSVTREDTAVYRGMVDKVRHLVTVEEVD